MSGGEIARARRAAVIERLRQPMRLDAISTQARQTVLGFRILSVCIALRRDPLGELTIRFDSLNGAKALLHLAEAVGRCWPAIMRVHRPCAPIMTPDEVTIWHMVDLASRGDRTGFSTLLDGFVRADRHPALFEAAIAAFTGADITG